MTDWRVRGSYFEACNCDAICPCRWQGGVKLVPGSSYGICDFALSWHVDRGHKDDLDLAGFNVVMAGNYRDDEPDKPWRVALYVDERADDARRAALADIFLGRVPGTSQRNFGKRIADVYAVRPARIELDHRPRRWWFRAEQWVEVKFGGSVEQPKPVTCGIPGHDRPGEEVVAESLTVNEAPLAFTFRGRCGFVSDFDYRAEA